MHWIKKVVLFAVGLAVAMTALGYALGFGWLSLLPALPTFIAASVLVPFFLGVRDRRLALTKQLNQGRRRRKPRKRLSRPAPAISIGERAPSAERGGRVQSALPAAPLS